MPQRRLSELDGEIISIEGRPQRDDCVFFTCPICEGGHSIGISWMAPSLSESNYIWQKTGTTIEDLTLNPSINCDVPWTDSKGVNHPSSCKFHGWIQGGWVKW